MSVLPIEAHCTHLAPLRAESRRRMTVVLALTAAVMVAEAVGGLLANSLALLADAGTRHRWSERQQRHGQEQTLSNADHHPHCLLTVRPRGMRG